MNFREQLFENKLTNISSEINLISKQLLLIQDFIVFEFGSKFKSFCEARGTACELSNSRTTRGSSKGPTSSFKSVSPSASSTVAKNKHSMTKRIVSIKPQNNITEPSVVQVIDDDAIDYEENIQQQDSEDSSGFDIGNVFVKCEQAEFDDIDVTDRTEESAADDSFFLEGGFEFGADTSDRESQSTNATDSKRIIIKKVNYTRKRDPDFPNISSEAKIKHVCNICKKVFYWTRDRKANGLQAHMRTHEDSPPNFACTVEGCGRVYTHVTGLHKHLRNVHPRPK